jgi:CRISPR/Cas system-associated protein Cas7 (RAMP superfamily)
LLGYDFGVVAGKTHFYDQPAHSGVGKARAYLDDRGNVLPAISDFDHFKDRPIFLVGESNIKSLPLISYRDFIKKLGE